jgi:hypothetical protein
MDFTIEQVDQAIEFVIRNAAEDRAETVAYTRVFEAADLPAPQLLHAGDDPDSVTRFMKAFHDRCNERGLPPLDSLVVHVGPPREGKPGGGYFKVNGWPDPYGKSVSDNQAEEALLRWGGEVEACKAWGKEHRRARRRRASE